MIKISVLNKESEEESGSEEEVTREALEQIALQQYAKALELQRKGNIKEATQLLKDLLDTQLLYDVKKPTQGEKVSNPLLNLKYTCYKNLASILSKSDEIDAAIEAYIAASELDDTDVTLWYRLGQLCLRAKRYEMSLHAFQRGVERNPRHWPSIDKIITLLLGLGFKEECITAIYDAVQLDPGYLRGLVYRKHILTDYPHIRPFMEYFNPIYRWNENDEEVIDEIKAEVLLKEAKDIHETFLMQQRSEQFKYILPQLKLIKPISNLTWHSVGESLVHMHHYMSDNAYSHACTLEMIFEKEKKEEAMEVCVEDKIIENVENKVEENNTDSDKNVENISGNENNELSDKEDAATDTEKVESDVEGVQTDAGNEIQSEPKIPKKNPVRRRGSALSFLQQWEWCYKRRSGRKKPAGKDDDNIYDTLRRMFPSCLSPEVMKKNEKQGQDISLDTTGLNKLFDEEKKEVKEITDYFGSENEHVDVKSFINKYTENKRDIIDMLKDYLNILSVKWRDKWPEELSAVYIEANKCYMNHVDIPSCTSDNHEELLHYTLVNILVEEFSVNKKLVSPSDAGDAQHHDLPVIETIGMILNLNPHIFSSNCLELMLRHVWVKLHIHILNKNNESALDCLYQLDYEFEAMGDHRSTYSLNVVNFTFKPVINEQEIFADIKFLERNKKLSTVMSLYEKCDYEEVLSIVIESFEHCKEMAKNEDEEMSLDFAAQLALILDAFWSLNKVDECFKWSLICLHEALKHYFRYTTGSQDYDKWTRTVVKILSCMEHLLSNEGLACLDAVSDEDLGQGVENLIRIIGHQVETNATEMPFGTVLPWIILYYILQREEDQGRLTDLGSDEVPNPLLLLFIAHEHLGKRGWCCYSKGQLLYFTLDIVVPRLRSPILSKSLEQVFQYMEQCVYCLFGHPTKKNKLKYLVDHGVTPHTLDWQRAQQLYEIYMPQELPALEGKVPCISAHTEQLFQKILSLLPPENDPSKYLPDIKNYIDGHDDKLPNVPHLIPFKMRDIYFLLGDYYFKRDEAKPGVKFNMLDIIINNDRLVSWAELSLAKAVNLNRILDSCRNLNNEKDFLKPAKSIIRCFKKALDLDPTYCNILTEYGLFVYIVHSFCSRLLKQVSESLSMEDFEALEKQKEDMLDTTQKCFITVINELNNSTDIEKANEDSWLYFYMLGKVAEKRNKSPSVYLDYYMKAVKSLQETDATYPLKINYSTPSYLCIEVLELHYRIHASILKYIEQHESKPIAASIGKVFLTCIEEWKNGPFTKKPRRDGATETEVTQSEEKPSQTVHAANILKRSVSDAGEEESHEAKIIKMESAAAKIRRSASYDTERLTSNNDPILQNDEVTEISVAEDKKLDSDLEGKSLSSASPSFTSAPTTELAEGQSVECDKNSEKKRREEIDVEKKDDSSSNTSSSSSSDSSSSESSSDSSSDSVRDSDSTSKSSNDAKPLTDEEIMKIVSSCLDALEDCISRFSVHYKALYRLAHYHFYYKRGKDIERCRDLMLATFTSRAGQKVGGLFSERKPSNFFNNIWKLPGSEVERAGGFAFHMSRSVLLTLEILKEIDDHKTLLDISLHLQRIPDPDKKYLRDSDREELAQQAFLLCVQSLKGILTKFCQQADVKSNDVERQALRSLMIDIYKSYQRVQKQPNSKQFINLLVESYKLVTTEAIPENANLIDLSMKYCQKMKQDATMASLEKSQNTQKKQAAKATPQPTEIAKTVIPVAPIVHQPKPDLSSKSSTSQQTVSVSSNIPKMSSHEMAAAFQSFMPILNDPVLTQQTAAALSLSYLSNISALAGYNTLPTNLQSSINSNLQNSFQAEFYRQYLTQNFSSLLPPTKKQKRGPKPGQSRSHTNTQMKPSKSFSAGTIPTSAIGKTKPTTAVSSLQKSSSTSLTPSMGTVLQNLPSSMTTNLVSFGAHKSAHTTHSVPTHAHMSTASTVNAAIISKPPMPHQQVSPGKTLQEKLAERQKHLPISKNQDINASISKLPSSLTITKTSVPKQVIKRPEAKKTLPFSTERPKHITTDEVIVLDDD